MSEESDTTLNAGVDGDPVYCSNCESPIVLYSVPQSGYLLVCSCPQTTVNVNSVVSESNLFSPVTGRWSQLDDIDIQTDY